LSSSILPGLSSALWMKAMMSRLELCHDTVPSG
jgi:hypothetical protein